MIFQSFYKQVFTIILWQISAAFGIQGVFISLNASVDGREKFKTYPNCKLVANEEANVTKTLKFVFWKIESQCFSTKAFGIVLEKR